MSQHLTEAHLDAQIAFKREASGPSPWDITHLASEMVRPMTDAERYVSRLEEVDDFDKLVMGRLFALGLAIVAIAVVAGLALQAVFGGST